MACFRSGAVISVHCLLHYNQVHVAKSRSTCFLAGSGQVCALSSVICLFLRQKACWGLQLLWKQCIPELPTYYPEHSACAQNVQSLDLSPSETTLKQYLDAVAGCIGKILQEQQFCTEKDTICDN
jgi:hypothetical protein